MQHPQTDECIVNAKIRQNEMCYISTMVNKSTKSIYRNYTKLDSLISLISHK